MNSNHKSDDYRYTEDDHFFSDLQDRNWVEIGKQALFMVFFGFIGWWLVTGVLVLSVINFALTILQGEPNLSLSNVISRLGRWQSDIADFLGQEKDDRPWPLGKDFPK